MAITVEIVSHKLKVKAAKGRILSEVLQEAGLPLSLYCRGRGLCGKCFVKILSAPRPAYKEGEEKLLALRGLDPDHRLACLLALDRSLAVSVPDGSLLERMPILSWGIDGRAEFDPAIKKYYLEMPPTDLARPESSWSLLGNALKLPFAKASLEVVRSLPSMFSGMGGRITAVLHQDEEVLTLEPGDTSSRSLGLAVDLGTTTLVMDLVDLTTGRVLDSETALNSQTAYGADVVSRISLIFSKPEKAGRLQEVVVEDLNRMAAVLLKRNHRAAEDIYEAVVAGNTAMSHLLARVPTSSLAFSPFNPVFSVLPPLASRDLGLDINPRGRIYLAPNIKSFVGGDISAGLLASGFFDRPGTVLYIDLGTNGEIALKKDKDVIVTSTAAGPAFEGMNISHGMLAVPGAICRAEPEGGFRLFTIGDRPPRGICGTGLIDIVAVGLGLGLITPQGTVTRPEKTIPLAAGVTLNQKDVRELQLAAAAIKAGMRMLLASAGLRAADLDAVFIAGAFGNSLDTARAMSLGLLPSINPGRITFLGNASLAGARVLLVSLAARRRLESIVGAIRHYSLASEASFQDTFVSSLEFVPWG